MTSGRPSSGVSALVSAPPSGDMLGLTLGLGIGRQQAAGGAGGGATLSMPIDTPLIVVGDSIVNVSNAAYSSHRAFRHWVNAHLNGHFYMGPASNQGVGGGTITSTADAIRYIGRRKDWWLNQISDGSGAVPRTAVFFSVGSNDLGKTSVTSAELISTMETHVTEVLDAGGIVLLGAIIPGTGNQTAASTELSQWTAYNEWVASKHDPSSRIIALTSRATAIGTTTTHLYDGLHPNGLGAFLIGQADAEDLAPYIETGTLLFGSTAPAENLEPNWDFAGTTGTAGTGASGTVATGWSVYCSSNGTSGGSTIGVTASCSKGTDADGNTAQVIELTGTATGAGVLTIINSVPINGQAGDFFEAWSRVALSATDGADPVGASSLGSLLGVMGGVFNKVVDANAGDVQRGFDQVWRTVPVGGLQNNGTANYEVSVGVKTGTVNIKLVVSQMGARACELDTYASLFNAGAAMFTSVQNPIGDRPRLNGTPGGTLTLQPSTITGGGIDSHVWRVKKDGVTVLTKNQGDTPMTYNSSGDSGSTLTLEHEAVRGVETITATSASVVVP